MLSYWASRKVCVLGGAGFIGSHLVDALLPIAKDVIVIDNFSSGSIENLPKDVEVHRHDLREFSQYHSLLDECDVVFHLASNVGGRAYLENHPQQMWENLEIDTSVFRACACHDVEKVVFFSSACVYPVDRDGDFPETSTNGIVNTDGVYGTAKLISEMMLQDFPFANVCIRPFTVYGPRMKENRSIGAFIAKTFIHQDPFEVWGNGDQTIDWIYVDDVVRGAILAASSLGSGVVNVGSGEVKTPKIALSLIWDYVDWHPKEITYLHTMPSSPLRVSNSFKMKNLGWDIQFSLEDGLQETVDWYYQTHDVQDVRETLKSRLFEI